MKPIICKNKNYRKLPKNSPILIFSDEFNKKMIISNKIQKIRLGINFNNKIILPNSINLLIINYEIYESIKIPSNIINILYDDGCKMNKCSVTFYILNYTYYDEHIKNLHALNKIHTFILGMNKMKNNCKLNIRDIGWSFSSNDLHVFTKYLFFDTLELKNY